MFTSLFKLFQVGLLNFLKASKRVGDTPLEERLNIFLNHNHRYIERWQKQHGKRSLFSYLQYSLYLSNPHIDSTTKNVCENASPGNLTNNQSPPRSWLGYARNSTKRSAMPKRFRWRSKSARMSSETSNPPLQRSRLQHPYRSTSWIELTLRAQKLSRLRSRINERRRRPSSVCLCRRWEELRRRRCLRLWKQGRRQRKRDGKGWSRSPHSVSFPNYRSLGIYSLLFQNYSKLLNPSPPPIGDSFLSFGSNLLTPTNLWFFASRSRFYATPCEIRALYPTHGPTLQEGQRDASWARCDSTASHY